MTRRSTVTEIPVDATGFRATDDGKRLLHDAKQRNRNIRQETALILGHVDEAGCSRAFAGCLYVPAQRGE